MKSPASYLWKTNTAEVTGELSQEILKSIGSMKEMVEHLENAVRARKPTDAINYGWVSNVEEHFRVIRNNISRINGAVLVRGTK